MRFANNNVYFGFHDGFRGGNNTLRLLAADAGSRATSSPASCRPPAGAPASMAIDIATWARRATSSSAGKFPRMGGVAVRGVSVHRGP